MGQSALKNREGYFDPTAGIAIRNIERAEKRMPIIHRGDIFYIEKYDTTGSEQQAGRPALVVSNNKCNECSDTIEVVYLTTAPKRDLPTHVIIRSTLRESTALCEQVTTVSTSKVKEFMCAANAKEMTQIDTALLISLDLTIGGPEVPKQDQKTTEPTASVEVPKGNPEPHPHQTTQSFEVAYRAEKAKREKEANNFEKRLVKAEAELAIYKGLYAEMTERAMGRVANG